MKKSLIFVSIISTSFAFSSCGTESRDSETSVISSFNYSLNVNSLQCPFEFHTERQLKFVNEIDKDKINTYATGASSNDVPLGYEITWEINPVYGRNVEYNISIFDQNENLYYEDTTNENKYTIYNLELGKEYTYKIEAALENGKLSDFTGNVSFNLSWPRNIYAPGLANIRDLSDLAHIKQGLLYRSAGLNKSSTTTYENLISSEGIKILREQLKIKSEIDLRKTAEMDSNENGGITQSVLGEDIQYEALPMIYGGSNILTNSENKDSILGFFNYLADKNNYPILFHCVQGKDRTGCMAYLLETLLGVDEFGIYKDYLFTNYSKISGMCDFEDIDNRYGKTISDYNGETLSEKAYNYLVDFGVSEETLDSIIEILAI